MGPANVAYNATAPVFSIPSVDMARLLSSSVPVTLTLPAFTAGSYPAYDTNLGRALPAVQLSYTVRNTPLRLKVVDSRLVFFRSE